MNDANESWPPAPEGQVIPVANPPADKTITIGASFSFYCSVLGLLAVIITRIVEYTGLFPDSEGRWYYQTTSLYARIRDEFFYFGSFLILGYCFVGLAILLGMWTRASRRGKIGFALGVGLIIIDIAFRIGVPLLVSEHEPISPIIIPAVAQPAV